MEMLRLRSIPNNPMPKISILIPTYNRAQYLVQAVQSIQQQTFTDWEIVVVDDGSTDNTQSSLDVFGKLVKYFYQPNQGVSVARNRAFRESVGDYIVFLDSDDWLLPQALETLWVAAQANPTANIIYGDAYLTDLAGKYLCRMSDYRPRPIEDTLESFAVEGGLGMLATMIRRHALVPLDGPFDEDMIGYEDKDLFFRLKASGAQLVYVPEPVCCYRFHGDNKSAPKSKWAERRRQSLIRHWWKVLESSLITTFSLAGQRKFFLDFLTGPLLVDFSGQKQVLKHPNFLGLPAHLRSQILYYLSIEILISDVVSVPALRYLLTAVRLCPQSARLYIWLSTFLLGRRFQKWLIRRYRHTQPDNDQLDPVIEVLRSKGVA